MSLDARSGGIVLDVKPGTVNCSEFRTFRAHLLQAEDAGAPKALRLHDQWKIRPRRMPTPEQAPPGSLGWSADFRPMTPRFRRCTACWPTWSWSCKLRGWGPHVASSH